MKSSMAFGAVALAALVASSILAAPAIAFAQTNPLAASRAEIIDANYSGPVFVDAYWVNSQTDTTKREVGPGEGVSLLAVVMVNRGFSDITSVTARLALPSGFKPGDGSAGSTVDASYNKLVSASDTFTVFFSIDVTRQAKVALYPATLDVSFNKVLEIGTPRTAEMGVQFRLPGKVLMDAASPTQSLSPGSANAVEVPIYNKGSAPATGVVATLVTSGSGNSLSISNSTTGNSTSQEGSQSAGVNVGTRVFDIGNIPAGQSVSIKPLIYPSSAAGGTIQNLTVRLTYGDAYGSSRTIDLPVELTVSPVPPKTALSISAVKSSDNSTGLLLSAGKIDDLNFAVTNTASDTLQNIAISVTTGNESLDILGDSRWTIPSLAPGETKDISAKVFAAKSLVGTPVSFTVTSQYVQGGQLNTDTLKVGKYVAGLVELKMQNLSINYINNVPNLVGSILNQGNTVALYTSVEIVQDGSGGQAASGARVTGAQGQFSQRSANITAGSEEVLRPISQTPQYLGDLNEDSPMPFSIPLRLARAAQSESGANAGPGQEAAQTVYPATIRITYTDDLGNSHTFTETRNVSFQPTAGSGTGGAGGFAGTGQFAGGQGGGFGQRGGFGLISMILYIGVPVAAGGGIAAYVIKRRKARKSRAKPVAAKSADDDLDAMLDNRAAATASEKDRSKGS